MQRPYVRIYSDKNKRHFIKTVKNIDWSTVYSHDNPDLAYDNFINSIEKCYGKCFPLQQLSRKQFKDKPWITSGLKKSSLVKNKKYRRIFKKTALEAENEYFRHKFDFKTNSVKKLWNNFNTVCSIGNKKSKKVSDKCVEYKWQ